MSNSRDGHIERNELILITRQFGGMLDAGIDILRILDVLREQFSNLKAKEIFASIEKDMRLGRLLSTALGRYPEVFSPFYISLIRQGELEGDLAVAFNKVAEHLARPLGMHDYSADQTGSVAMAALVDRVTPLAFWLALSSAATIIAIAGLWYATNAGYFHSASLGPNICLLIGVLILISSLVFAQLRPRQWVVCSFCGRSEQVVAYMRRAANGAICDACIESSHLAWQAQRPREEAVREDGKGKETRRAEAGSGTIDEQAATLESALERAMRKQEPHIIEEEEEEIISDGSEGSDGFQVVKEEKPY